MEILIVEKSRVQQLILEAVFRNSTVAISFVDSVDKAKASIQAVSYGAVISAAQLPDGKGIEIAQFARQHYGNQTVFVLLTSENPRVLLPEALAAGVSRVISRADTVALQNLAHEIGDSLEGLRQPEGEVLLVEDDPVMALNISTLMSAQGSRCTQVSGFQEAMEQLKGKRYDLLILDYYLSDNRTGLDIVKQVRKMDLSVQQTPILMLSAENSVEHRIEALTEGANDFLVKPIVGQELIARSGNLIKLKKLFDKVLSQQERLKDLAMTDQLTGLYNRHFLTQMAPKRLAEARRHKLDLSVMVVDIDHFKKINDNYGHEKGDLVLKAVATLLKARCREEDFAIRLGGEEFLILLYQCSLEGAKDKAESLRLALEKLKPESIDVTASFGITSLEKGSFKDFSELFNAADKALYEAKSTGRNKVVFKKLTDS